jgi:hypothetical protein
MAISASVRSVQIFSRRITVRQYANETVGADLVSAKGKTAIPPRRNPVRPKNAFIGLLLGGPAAEISRSHRSMMKKRPPRVK